MSHAASGLARIIDLIYDAGFDDEAFKILPEVLAASIGGRSATIQFLEADGTHFDFAWNHFTESMVVDFVANFKKDDVWANIIPDSKLNIALNIDSLISQQDFINSRIYNEFYRAHGDDTVHATACIASLDDGIAHLGVHRASKLGSFADEEVQTLQNLIPHLQRLHRMRFKFRSAKEKSELAKGALDRFPFGALMLKPDRRISIVNAAAEKIMRRADAFHFSRGRIQPIHWDTRQQFNVAVFAATVGLSPEGRALQVPRKGSGRPYRVMVQPMPGRRSALVIIDDPDDNPTSDPLFRDMYGFSAAETKLALALLAGHSPEEIAAQRDVRISTVRTQLSSLLRKTDTERQSELIGLLGKLPRIQAI